MTSTIGWILWGILALGALFFLISSILNKSGDRHSRREVRLQSFFWIIALLVTALLPISKFHLLWMCSLGWVIPLQIEGFRLRHAGKGMEAEGVRRHLHDESDGEVWTYTEMQRVFRIIAVETPREYYNKVLQFPEFRDWWVARESGIGQVKVIRRADKVKGTLLFKDYPRFYFSWSPDATDDIAE